MVANAGTGALKASAEMTVRGKSVPITVDGVTRNIRVIPQGLSGDKHRMIYYMISPGVTKLAEDTNIEQNKWADAVLTLLIRTAADSTGLRNNQIENKSGSNVDQHFTLKTTAVPVRIPD